MTILWRGEQYLPGPVARHVFDTHSEPWFLEFTGIYDVARNSWAALARGVVEARRAVVGARHGVRCPVPGRGGIRPKP